MHLHWLNDKIQLQKKKKNQIFWQLSGGENVENPNPWFVFILFTQDMKQWVE